MRGYKQKHSYENLNKMIFDGVGEYGIPNLYAEQIEAKEFCGFNFARTCDAATNKMLHFFLDDYQFNRIWNKPDLYIDLILRFKCVCTPDFSTYADFPKVIQIYNHYRKHWLGAYWQAHGGCVIPTISWSDRESFSWCFDGEPKGGAVAVSSVGTQDDTVSQHLFMNGYMEMLKRLRPSMIYFYGDVPEGCQGNIIRIPAFQNELKMRCKTQKGVV
ncbi:MAG: DUF4417 domain-containing protein [Clostridia bacterium]|nr:DUF4417 domain-containing protein [Clostridia bacterium]